ncbi:MAG: sulfurtransferase TusA family protein [Rhodospirillales bacterium]|nr:sulfurtransferase TusA family protein [Rhodospirillales bacterium]
MNNCTKPQNGPAIDVFLDITGEICPMTFVKTKLMIESMQPGQVAEVRLQGKEPLENVPRSVRDFGHEIISLDAEDPKRPPDDIHRLVLRKT